MALAGVGIGVSASVSPRLTPPPRFRHLLLPARCGQPLDSPHFASAVSSAQRALGAILESRIVACLRAHDAETATEAARAALDGGISVLEIVSSSPGALKVLRSLRKDYPLLTFGVGTVLNVEDAHKAIEAGAQFLMSPGTVMDILNEIDGAEVLYIPGVMTPTEVLSACNSGARIVKVYPVTVLGGERYISALRRPFPHIPLVASQGVMAESIGQYIEAGAAAMVLSDSIFNREALRDRNFGEIRRLATIAISEASGVGNIR